MILLYQDKYLVICVKPIGVDSEKGMPQLLAEELKCECVYCVHRLDKAVGGVMVYALDGKTAAKLSALFSSSGVEKEYLAVSQGCMDVHNGEMRDLLYHDVRKNKTYVVNRMRGGVKEAVLRYEYLESVKGAELYRILLKTGRSHQIRVQFASRKHPLLGDAKYGSSVRDTTLALWCWRLMFEHPYNHKKMEYTVTPPKQKPWEDSKWLFDNIPTGADKE